MILGFLSTLCLPQDAPHCRTNESDDSPSRSPNPLPKLPPDSGAGGTNNGDGDATEENSATPAAPQAPVRSCLRSHRVRLHKSNKRVSFADEKGSQLSESITFEAAQEDIDDNSYSLLVEKVRRQLAKAVYQLEAYAPLTADGLSLKATKDLIDQWVSSTGSEGVKPNPSPPNCHVEMIFHQPMADFAKFSQTLETYNVALQNVWLSDYERRLNGSIRVRSIVCDKKYVVVRSTTDGWMSSTETPAKFVSSDISKINDIFLWDLDVESLTKSIFVNGVSVAEVDFYVCLKICRDNVWTEFHDSNGGPNFELQLKIKPRDSVCLHLTAADDQTFIMPTVEGLSQFGDLGL